MTFFYLRSCFCVFSHNIGFLCLFRGSYVSPIFFHSKERTYNGFGTDLQRRLNEGRTKDVIRSFLDWCNTLEMKKIKKFFKGVLHLLRFRVIFLLIISALDVV